MVGSTRQIAAFGAAIACAAGSSRWPPAISPAILDDDDVGRQPGDRDGVVRVVGADHRGEADLVGTAHRQGKVGPRQPPFDVVEQHAHGPGRPDRLGQDRADATAGRAAGPCAGRRRGRRPPRGATAAMSTYCGVTMMSDVVGAPERVGPPGRARPGPVRTCTPSGRSRRTAAVIARVRANSCAAPAPSGWPPLAGIGHPGAGSSDDHGLDAEHARARCEQLARPATLRRGHVMRSRRPRTTRRTSRRSAACRGGTASAAPRSGAAGTAGTRPREMTNRQRPSPDRHQREVRDGPGLRRRTRSRRRSRGHPW